MSNNDGAYEYLETRIIYSRAEIKAILSSLVDSIKTDSLDVSLVLFPSGVWEIETKKSSDYGYRGCGTLYPHQSSSELKVVTDSLIQGVLSDLHGTAALN